MLNINKFWINMHLYININKYALIFIYAHT